MSEYYPKYYEGSPRGSLEKFWPNGASGCQLASVGPSKLIKKINYFILSLGMHFDYSNSPVKHEFMYNIRKISEI